MTIIRKDKLIVGIIGGKGKMGRLFADFFRGNGISVIISDTNTKLTNEKLTAKADMVIVSVPIHVTCDVIKKIVRHIKRDAVLMDLTSVKTKPIKEMLKCKGEVIGLHPMFSGNLPINGQTVIMCPVRSRKWAPWIKNLFKKNNVNVKILTPEAHDEIMAAAQDIVHCTDIVFIHALKKFKKPIGEILQYTSSASDLKIDFAARLIAQDPKLYGSIQIENPDSKKVFSSYMESLKELSKIVSGKDLAGFEKYFNECKTFLGNYSEKAYGETNWIIEKILKKRGKLGRTAEILPKDGEIGVLGPKHTYSDIVCDIHFPNAKRAYFMRVEDIFEAIGKNKIKKGIVPIENMLFGTVRETLDELFKYNFKIIKEINLPVHHCLIALFGTKINEIKKIYSHDQAIKQCRKFLEKECKKAEVVPCFSTAFAIQKLLEENDGNIGVIGSKEAANAHGLHILKENIEDSIENKTTFAVMSKKEEKVPLHKKAKTSIAFHFAKDKPGSLFLVFKDFAEAKINMTKIESRPARKELGEYVFFVDFEGNIKDKKVKNVLAKIAEKTKTLKMLGTYPSP